MELVPVDHDPFAGPAGGGAGPQLIPVDHDPFAGPSVAADVAQSAGIGTVKGTIGLAGAPGDIQELGTNYNPFDYLAKKYTEHFPEQAAENRARYDKSLHRSDIGEQRLPRSAEIQKQIEGVTGEFYKPKTVWGEYGQTTGEFGPAALMGPVGAGRKLLTQALIPGVVSETAGQVTKGTPFEPWARVAGAVGAGAGAAVLSRPSSATSALRSQLPDFVTDAHIDRAGQLIDHAASKGVNVTWPEALSRVTGRPVLLDAQRIAESSPQSRGQMEDFLGDRAQQVSNAAPGEIGNIGSRSNVPSSIGPKVGEAADTAVNDVRQNINAVAEPFYNAAKPVLLTAAEMAKVRAIPGFKEAADAVRADPHLSRYVQGLPEDSVGFLNEVKKLFDQQARNASSPLQPGANVQRAASLSQSAGDVRNAAVAVPTSNAYETALAIEKTGREQFLDPLLRGPLGRIADKDITTQKAIAALFPPNPLPNSQHEISTAVSAVAKSRPEAAAQLVRAHVESVFNEATQSLQGGPSQWGGSKFAAVLTGNPQQRANLKAAVEALPNGQARWAGFENFLSVMEAIGKRQAIGSRTSFNTEELKGLSSGSFPAEVVKLGASPGKWLSVINDKWSKWQLGSNLRDIAQIITDPKAGPLLGRIAKLPPASRDATVTAARLIVQSVGVGNRDYPALPAKQPAQ